jgi:hypothetical protein
MNKGINMQWIAVDKKLPDDGEDLLLIRTIAHFSLGTFEDMCFLDEEGNELQCVSHWAYVYEPPGYE